MTGDMYGDFSRLTFAPEKHFSAVLIQQGRVSLDADANELTAILRHWMRRLTVDLVGPHAAPAGADANFAVTLDTTAPNRPVLGLAPGHCYVDGLLVETDRTTYEHQPDGYLDPDRGEDRLPVGEPYVVYLRVWERHITAIEDPSIRELALGDAGPDTAARSKVVWQVRVARDFPPGSGDPVSEWPAVDGATARQKWEEWAQARASAAQPTMRAATRRPREDDLAPCIAPPDARYRGLENQLYRVEIHTGGTAGAGGATFKWSRDNGTATFAVRAVAGREIRVESLGRDLGLGLDVGNRVELRDDRSTMRGERHPLLEVTDVDRLDRLVTVAEPPADGIGDAPELHPLLRRWDQRPEPVEQGYAPFDAALGVFAVVEGDGDDGWLELESGIQIQFAPGGRYTAGDYWLIPARTTTTDIEWPRDGQGPAARPPVGIGYAYAPLAVVDGAGVVTDLRSLFAPPAP